MANRDVYIRFSVTGAAAAKAQINQMNSALDGMQKSMKFITGSVAFQLAERAFTTLKNGYDEAINQSISFEKALTAVQRRSGASSTWIKNFGEDIKGMSENMPQTAETLLSIAENASQLGIANEDLLEFTEIMAGMGSVSNMSAEDASTAFARMANIMHTSAADYERIGSTVLYLGSNYATTESEIADFSLTLAATGRAFKLSEADVMGLGAAMSSLGITSSSGATSINRTFQIIESAVQGGSDKLKTFADTAGMTSFQFAEMWKNDKMTAFTTWLQGLQGSEYLTGTLSDSGIKTQKTIKDIMAMSAGYGVVQDAIENANNAWEQNTALAEQTGIEYGTASARMQEAKNAVNNLKAAIGDRLMPIENMWLSVQKDTAQQLREAIGGYGDISENIKTIDRSYEASLAGMQRNYRTVGALIDEIDGIGNAVEGSQAWYDRLALMKQIKDVMPQIAGGMNLKTGEINGGTEALRTQADATMEAAEATLQLQKASEGLDALAIAQQKLADQKSLRAMEYANLADQDRNTLDKIEQLDDEYMRRLASGRLDEGWLAQYGMETGALQSAMSDAAASVYSLDHEISASEEEINEYSEAITTAANHVKEAVGTETDALTEIQQEAADDLGNLFSQVQAYNQLFEEVKNSAKESLESSGLGTKEQTGAKEMWTWGDNEERPGDAGDITDTIDTNAKKMREYAENLQKVQEMGLEGEALSNLADGSKYSADILNSLVEGGPEAIQEYMDSIAGMQEAEDALATAMAEASTTIQDAQTELATSAQAASDSISDMVANADQSEAASSATSSTMQGLISGIDAQIGTLREKVSTVNSLMSQLASLGGGDGTGHAQGLEYVPRDNYFAVLHRGEMVLTSAAARAYREEQRMNFAMLQRAAGTTVNNVSNDSRRTQQISTTNNYNIGGIYPRREIDIDDLTRKMNRKSASRAHGVGR